MSFRRKSESSNFNYLKIFRTPLPAPDSGSGPGFTGVTTFYEFTLMAMPKMESFDWREGFINRWAEDGPGRAFSGFMAVNDKAVRRIIERHTDRNFIPFYHPDLEPFHGPA